MYSLVDTGCTNSVLNFNFFKQILNQKNDFKVRPSNFILNLAEQDNTLKVMGETHTLVEITDIRGNKVSFMHKFLLIKNLNHDVFMGSDILSSEWVYAKTRNEIIFNKIPGKIYNTSKMKNNNNFVVIPISP